MSSRQKEFNKIKMYKENWYALTACICSEKAKSISQSCRKLGVDFKNEKAEKIVYNDPKFDIDGIIKLRKEGALI
ncbi:hypothetical protein LGL08_20390 [Clostridium estertheticum]|uniref:hypothetical protein n=1 Tax=Clostridium estertheticum TaxID=238834 RepID=UPI001CF260A4|nr:hypothetical protein [Clostridium estertheticum]MCB2308859.1 hypothetical protein [Clostridium estertheticum]MCB2347271.1 hypothetical protein [Clostridium estertheticum]MCB2351888.1 hypothetical protein [Clostridium estertheticum]WAG48474.1 hypothetical protein LL127_23415 [Clostridium estertheticum]